MKYKDKVKLARRMRSPHQEHLDIPIFQTKQWELRKQGIAERVKRNQSKNEN